MALTDQQVSRLTDERLARTTLRSGSRRKFRRDELPPSLPWPALAQSVGLLRFRHRFVPWMHRKFGDVFTVRLIPGSQPLVLFARPEAAREIFAGNPEFFHAGKGNAVLGPIMGDHSLLLVDGADHKRTRKLLMPAFNGAALHSYESLVADVARDEVSTWRDGETFRSLDRMNALTLEVILRVVFGVTDAERLDAMRPRVNQIVNISPVILLGWGWPRLQKYGPWKAQVENQRALDRLIYTEIAERRDAPDLAERTDVLSRLILIDDAGDRLSDEELRDQLVTLLLAGHETTATALAWALHEVGRDPELLDRTRTAAREGDTTWLEAVLKESMRLHPVIPMVVRTLMRPATIGGVDLPAGVTVGPSIILAHAREENHAEAGRFHPDRFLEPHGNRVGPAANTWIPFGGGVRRCIGAGFSLMEGVAVLREVFAAFDVEAVGEDEPKVRNITSVPREGATIRVTATRR
ncbi:cytochrome P450 [Nocardioides sp. Root151]|uniref:cytochrome P450 n=1 Tax=Nocardioides sp. Root151 TaxID=1736475 RepID=UPI0009EB4375|nr:cytochrome P450 [Nocardioides sp. Root151]